MRNKLFFTLIIGLLSVFFAATASLAQKNRRNQADDIWKQLPVTQPAYDKEIAQAPINPKKLDKSNINVRAFDSAAIANYLDNDDFLYDRPKITSESFIKRFRRWLRQLLGDSSEETEDADWLEYFFYTIAALIIGFVVTRLLGLNMHLFIRKPSSAPEEFIVGSENIHVISFEAEIANAERQADFRRAVRLHYLQLLKQLSDSGLIEWLPQKTNMQYVAEMAKTPFGSDFESLTRTFAYIWYGYFEMDEESYRLFKKRKTDLTMRLPTPQTAKA